MHRGLSKDRSGGEKGGRGGGKEIEERRWHGDAALFGRFFDKGGRALSLGK